MHAKSLEKGGWVDLDFGYHCYNSQQSRNEDEMLFLGRQDVHTYVAHNIITDDDKACTFT